MMIYFSATTLWFYNEIDKDKYVAGIGWPDDAILITADEHARYSDEAPVGFVLSANDKREPVWSEAPPPSHEQLVSAAEAMKSTLRAEADKAIEPLGDAVSLGIATDDESASYDSWRKYRVLLNRIDTSAAPDISWPELPA